jgi:[ribosomal protein S5]-alanine N-acetyltransferase
MTTLTAERLVIRNLTIDYAPALWEIILQYQASEYAAYDHAWPTSVDEIRGVVEWFASGDAFLAVCLRESGGLIGYVALNPVEEASVQDHQLSQVYGLGYCFNFDYHGRGYATEAGRAVLGRAFDELDADRVTAGTAAANAPSCSLLARLGFRRVGESTASFRSAADGMPIEFPVYSFALDRDDWICASSRG